ncbi:MAG: GNAT family N-acetyltransferase [Chloroflexi bacterium]|nr:GNAT family N-acetyltransferase [Chloroflexota bacterium]
MGEEPEHANSRGSHSRLEGTLALREPSFTGNVASTTLVGKKVKLRPKRLQDAVTDYGWRTDTELCHLDAAPPMKNSFEEFLSDYTEQLRHPVPGLRFAIETQDGKHIGNLSLFNCDDGKKKAELGIMIGDKAYWDQGYGKDAVTTVIDYVFTQTTWQNVFLKTLDWNIRAHKCFERCGFISKGMLHYNGCDFIIMEISRQG